VQPVKEAAVQVERPVDEFRGVRWAIVGSGEFAIDWLATLTAIVSRDPDRVAPAASRLGVRTVTSSIGDLRGVADAVHIATPNHLHVQQAVEAAGHGLHVLVEKPMAMTVDQCRPMVAAASAAGVLLAVGSCMAWAPPVDQAVSLIRSGAIGVPLHAAVWAGFDSPPAGLWRQERATSEGGGPLYDLGAHAVDALIRMLGPVASVTAMLGNLRHRYPAEDTATVSLAFRSGVHGTLHLSFATALNALRVDGSDGRLDSREWLGRRFRGDLSLTMGEQGASGFAAEADGQAGPGARMVPLEPVDVFAAQAEETSAAIRRHRVPRNSPGMALAVVEVLEAAVVSAAEGRRVDLVDAPAGREGRP
jgi:predicted dehydrogenase